MGSGPSRRGRSNAVRLFVASVAAGVGVASCASGSSSAPPAPEPVEADRSVARSVPSADSPSVLTDSTLNPEGVINAAIALRTGGAVDAALEAGAFTRAELDAARAALADGSLDYLFD